MIPADNPSSWQAVLQSIDEYPVDDQRRDWRILATRFIQDGVDAGLDRYFRAGNSMHHILFSAIDDHQLGDNPRVTIVFNERDTIQVAYGTKNLHFGDPELAYSLPYVEAFDTFRRFLNQLWADTKSEPIPAGLRAPDAPFDAPILTPTDDPRLKKLTRRTSRG